MFVIENVRLIPNATIGKLIEESNALFWVNCENQSKADLFVSECESILIDKLSSTAIFSSQQKGIKMIHFMNTEEMSNLVQYLEQLEHFANTAETTNCSYVQFTKRISGNSPKNDDLDEATLNLLEAFSKVPLMAKGLISKLKGEPDYLHRPRGIRSTAIPTNPWIIDRPIELPACRMKFDVEERNTEEWSQLPEHLRPRIIYNSAGKILNTETRREFWLSVLKTDEADYYPPDSSLLDTEAVSRIEKDLYRLGEADQTVLIRLEAILKDYSVIDPQLSYVQGMVDLALPFAKLFDNQSDAFICFKMLMKRLRSNFIDTGDDDDEFGMQNQLKKLRDLIEDFSPLLSDYLKFNRDSDSLFFAYRWLLVLFRREFHEVERLWDVMWAAQCCDIARIEEFRIYVALAMILSQKTQFMKTCSRFEDVLKYFNDMSGNWDLDEILKYTDQLINYNKNNK